MVALASLASFQMNAVKDKEKRGVKNIAKILEL